MRHSSTKLLLAAVAVIGVLAMPSSAAAAPGMEIAAQDDFALVTDQYGSADREEVLDLASRFETRWIRANVLWAAANGKQARSKKKPATPSYDFGSFDRLINAARSRGMQVELTLSGTAPAWATGNKKIGPYKPNAKYFREFVRAAAQHFGGNITRYAVWNEPNLAPWLAPLKTAPKQYKSLYAGAYTEIKKANPNAQVLIGETSPYGNKGRSMPPIEFIRKMLAGTKLKADGYAHHPYDFQHKPSFKWKGSTNATLGTISNLTKELDRQAKAKRLLTPGGKALDVYVTEYGYLRQGRFKITEAKRAAYLKEAYTIALKNPRIKQMLQYMLVEPGKKYAFFDMSLFNRSGTPFGAAYQGLVDWAAANRSQLNGSGG